MYVICFPKKIGINMKRNSLTIGSTIFFYFIIFISLTIFAQEKSKNKKIVTLKDSYWENYGGDEKLSIKSITEDKDVKGRVKVLVQHNVNNFLHFLISNNGDEFKENLDGVISADFDLSDSKEEIVEFEIKVISSNDKTSPLYKIKLLSNSNKYWSSRGAMGYPNWITVKTEPYINFASKYRVKDWVYIQPTKEEIEFANFKWGSLIDENKSNYENAKEIAKSVLNDLSSQIGTPSDSMKVRPFVQYERMIERKDKGFCSNFAHIFIHACNSLGIPARRIHLQKIHSKTKDLNKISVRMGGMHSTVEIFDDSLDQWILMDYYSNSLGFYLGEEGPLNVIEFSLFLNETARRKNLRIHYYNPKTKEEKMIPISENPRTTYGSFNGKDTEFHYFIKNKD